MLAVFQVLSDFVRQKNLQVHLFNMAVLNQVYDYINIESFLQINFPLIAEILTFKQIMKFISNFSIITLDTPVSSANKTDRHDLTAILLKVALNTIAQLPINIQTKINRFIKFQVVREASILWNVIRSIFPPQQKTCK